MSPTEPCAPYVAMCGNEDKDEDPWSDPRVFI